MNAGKARRWFLAFAVFSSVAAIALSSQDLLAGAACGLIAALFLSSRRLIGSLANAGMDDWLWWYTAIEVVAGMMTALGWQHFSAAAVYWIAATVCLCTAFLGNYLDRYLRKIEALGEANADEETDKAPITREDLNAAVEQIGKIVTEKRRKKKGEAVAKK